MRYSRILFICRDNTTLGPMAEAMLKSIMSNSEVEIISRGMVVLFEGPINSKVEVVLGSHGLEVNTQITRPVTEQDFDRNTLVLTMTKCQQEEFYLRYPLIDVAMLSEFVEEQEILDPYGGNLMDYEKCFGQLMIILKKLAVKLEKEIL